MPRTSRRSTPVRTESLGVDYFRYSTEEQGSAKEQRAINEELSHDEGVAIVARFGDEGISRSISDRPGLQKMFAYLEANPEVGFIIVNELERMTAGVNQRQEIVRLCKRLNITIITEDMGRINPHDEDKMQEADQRAVTAKGEVLKVRRRTRRNLRQKVRTKEIVAMRPPYGIRMVPLTMPDGRPLPSGMAMVDPQGRKITSGEIERHPDEYPWLVQIFEWADEGCSLSEITRRLMAAGVPTKTGKFKWDATTLSGILKNPIYKGEMSWGSRQTLRDEEGRRYYELREEDDPGRVTLASPLGAIVDIELWERVNNRRVSRPRSRMSHARESDPQPLDHYVFCGRCGHKMYGRADRTQKGLSWRYLCLSSYGSMNMRIYPEYGRLCTSSHSISAKDVLAALAGLPGYGGKTWTVTARAEQGAEERSLDARQRRLAADIEDARAEGERAVNLAIKGFIDEAKLEATQTDVAQRIAAAEAELAGLVHAKPRDEPVPAEMQAFMADLAERLADTTVPVEFRRQLISQTKLEAIYVDKPALSLRFRQ